MSQSFHPEELQRYARHISLKEVGLEGQQRLKSAKVLCIGAGGLGSPLLLYLASAGLGTLGIVEDDCIELSNLARQILYATKDLRNKKVDTAKTKLELLNPHIHLVTHHLRLNEENALKIISQYDFVADCTDNFMSRYIINDACFQLKKPFVSASIFQFEGQCSVFFPEKGPCYRCIYPEPPSPESAPTCEQAGVLGILPGILGTIQATEVIKLILGIGSPLIGRLLTLDALSMQFQEYRLQKNAECSLCTGHLSTTCLYNHMTTGASNLTTFDSITVKELYQLQQQKADFILLDVREFYETQICSLGGILIPLHELKYRLKELDHTKLIIIYCKSGSRSRQAFLILKENGFSLIKYLEGGILVWADEIDSTMPVY